MPGRAPKALEASYVRKFFKYVADEICISLIVKRVELAAELQAEPPGIHLSLA
jgi:hypothetical protein